MLTDKQYKVTHKQFIIRMISSHSIVSQIIEIIDNTVLKELKFLIVLSFLV